MISAVFEFLFFNAFITVLPKIWIDSSWWNTSWNPPLIRLRLFLTNCKGSSAAGKARTTILKKDYSSLIAQWSVTYILRKTLNIFTPSHIWEADCIWEAAVYIYMCKAEWVISIFCVINIFAHFIYSLSSNISQLNIYCNVLCYVS